MSEVCLIRHGQASFGAENYDRLSELGRRQARWLGERLAGLGVRPARIVAGTLSRQRATADALLDGLGGARLPVETHAGLNEYDAEPLLAAWLESLGADAPRIAGDDRRGHFRALSGALEAWQAGRIEGAESWAAFEARTAAALAHAARPGPKAGDGSADGAASVSRLFVGGRTPWLSSFNETPHLDGRPGAVTYS